MTRKRDRAIPAGKCEYCNGSGEFEPDNNGPISACPVCEGSKVIMVKRRNKKQELQIYESALSRRACERK